MAKKQSHATLGRVGRVEREKRINRIIRISMIALLAVVAAVVIGGLVIDKFITPAKVVATVFGEEITVGEFQIRVKMQRANMVAEHDQYYQLMSQIEDQASQQQYANIIAQYEYQLEAPEIIGESTLNQMVDDVLIKREALARDIEVSDAEITEAIQSVFGYFPNPEVPEKPAEDGAEALPAAPVPTSITEEEYQTQMDEYLDSNSKYGVDEVVIYQIIEAMLYREKLTDLLAEGISTEEDQVWARHILVEDEETAESILVRLEEGEAFTALAPELSIDPSAASNYGDLGWFNAATMIPEFSEAAFSAEVGDIVGPVETTYGFHIIEIMGHEHRPMSEDAL
ncbi:MAG: peptidylprolyl isomerase, partial [Chloroflexota bacterium]